MRPELDAQNRHSVVAEEDLLVDHDRRVRAVVQGASGVLFVLTDFEDNDEQDRHFTGKSFGLPRCSRVFPLSKQDIH